MTNLNRLELMGAEAYIGDRRQQSVVLHCGLGAGYCRLWGSHWVLGLQGGIPVV